MSARSARSGTSQTTVHQGAEDLGRSQQLDQHGFVLSVAQAASYSQWARISAAAERVQLQHWAQHLSENGTPPAISLEKPWAVRQAIPRHKQIKRLIRGGIPPPMRHKLWLEISGAQARREAQPTLYNELLERAASNGCPARNEIEKDLHRTFPNNSAFDADAHGRRWCTQVWVYFVPVRSLALRCA